MHGYYYWLINATKRRLIEELRDSFEKNPYFSKMSAFIQDKYTFEERPQQAIIVKGSSSDRVILSPQNFIGTMHSYIMKATIGSYPAIFIEWIREDTIAIQRNNHVFPTPPAIFLVQLLAVDALMAKGQIQVERVRSIIDEPLITFETGTETTATLADEPMNGSIKLFTSNAYFLIEGEDYTVEAQVITFTTPFQAGTSIIADYKVWDGFIGEFAIEAYTAYNQIIPGVVIAFGNRLKVGDRCAIVVTPTRTAAFQEYGGHFNMSFDLDIIARDPKQAEQISDFSVMALLDKKELFEDDGLTLNEGPSQGGEAEDVYDEEGNENYHTQSVKVGYLTDWAYYKPLPITIAQILPVRVIAAIMTPSVVDPDKLWDVEKMF
jgi:hypothetical protein